MLSTADLAKLGAIKCRLEKLAKVVEEDWRLHDGLIGAAFAISTVVHTALNLASGKIKLERFPDSMDKWPGHD